MRLAVLSLEDGSLVEETDAWDLTTYLQRMILIDFDGILAL